MSRRGTGERRGLALNEAEGARLWPAMMGFSSGWRVSDQLVPIWTLKEGLVQAAHVDGFTGRGCAKGRLARLFCQGTAIDGFSSIINGS